MALFNAPSFKFAANGSTFVGSVELNDNANGLKASIRFQPGGAVDATLLGLVQAVLIVQGDIRPTWAIDPAPNCPNPVYAMGNQLQGSFQIADGIPNLRFGSLGAAYVPNDGPRISKEATLIDPPAIVGGALPRGQTFHTTCLALRGAQRGRYYGCISWGWVDDSEGARVLPTTLLTARGFSDEFGEARRDWNQRGFIQLPLE